MKTRTKYLNNNMKMSKETKKDKVSLTFWMMNKSTKDRMMLDCMASKLTKNRWNPMKMKVTHKKIKNFSNRKDKSPKKEKKASMYR